MSSIANIDTTQTQTQALANIVPETYDPNFKTRQEQARLACESAGIVWPGTILPPGTALYDSGVEKLKSDRAAWRRLPIGADVIGLVQEALRQEDRRDFPIKVQAVRLRPSDGRLITAQSLAEGDERPSAGMGYGKHTMRQLVQQIDPLDDAPDGFASALIYLSDQERAEIVNKRIQHTDGETGVTLRTRMPHQGDTRIARAALSEKYGSVTDFDLARALAQTLAGDKAGRLDYKPGDKTSRFEVIWPSELPVKTFVVGDIHYMTLSITNSETGEGSVRIVPALVRAACANLTLSTGEGISETVRHIGDPQVLFLRIQKAIRRAIEDMEPLIQMITMSAEIPLSEVWTPEKSLSAIANKYKLGKASVPVMLEAHKSSHYPDSIFGLASAISEAAHKGETWTDEAEWERAASDFQSKAVEVVKKGSRYEDAVAKALALN